MVNIKGLYDKTVELKDNFMEQVNMAFDEFEEINECNDELKSCKNEPIEYTECACVSLRRMHYIVSDLKKELISNAQLDKEKIFYELESLEHDIKLLNDSDNSIDRDLFK